MRIAIRKLIGQLKRFEISLRDVPEEFSFHKDILAAEREFGHRKEGNRGYDAIHGYFFVEEDIFFKNLAGELKSRKRVQKFDSIEEYYDFLDGDIYDRACYRFCDFAKYRSFLKEKKINISLLKERKSFLSETIDDVCISVSEDEIREYDEAEINKSLIIQWIDRFDQCKSGSELDSVVDEYWKTRLFEYIDLSFFFYNYVFKDINDQDRFNAVMEYMCTGRSPENVMINELCLLYGADKVFEKYDYKSGSRGNIYKHKRKLKEFIAILDSNQIQFKTTYYFDKRSHFYCENIEGYEEGYSMPLVSCKRYFETFDELISYTNGSLKQTDLSAAIRLNVDFSKYETDETTKLPPINFENLECNIKKEYHEGKFAVSEEWHTKEGSSVKELSFVTPYFFDFVYYLRGDMSGANLLYCDGLENLKDYKGIDFSGAVMTSKMCEKFGVLFERYTLNTDLVKSFPITEKNERDTSITTTEVDTEIDTAEINMHALPLTYNYNRLLQRVYYITDLHLLHRLKNANCRSKEDVRYVIQKIVNNIVSDAGRLILIGGDVSSDFSIYNLFVKLLRERIDREKYKEIEVVFVLGNHELWDFQGKKVDEIVNIYRKTIEENGMILLHNEILYGDSDDNYCKLSYEKLMSYSINELRRRLLSTRMVILGGAAFSGYNDEFNANNGIYRETLDRKGEVAESMKFEDLFKRVAPAISDTNTVILTHTPQKDWASDSRPLRNVVYVNGHTHRNEFYDDGDYRIYSDNQVGYNKENPHLKSFIIDGEYDCFTDYEDGIYEITGEQYNDFYRGKNIIMDFTRDVNILYMLKKQGYYCFIHKSKKGLLSIDMIPLK